ncbi:HNH endonuclease [Candidatus Spongiihabitans sp.]|uniref:HNH endonuclease n=1 Tax=Candidatus Spongiihabitans sp. TaxID=3101308 RepID=UPI003C7E3993
MKPITQKELVVGYFKDNPSREIKHAEIVDWLIAEYKKRTSEVFRDPDRQIRSLHQSGFLIKVDKGVYKYDPDSVTETALHDFTQQQKDAILKRDGYRCVMCGRSEAEGVELHVDHVKAKDKGGAATISNGQTLCAMHNYRKKNYKQTEAGKKMFIRLYEQAKEIGDDEVMKFCEKILTVYENCDVNGHIEWRK